MSGIEIVGLILGALPLLASSIEQCSAALSTTGRLLHPQHELRNLQKRINTEHLLFRNTARNLLLKVTNESDVAELLDDPNSGKWKDKEFDPKLRQLLGPSHETWIVVMKDVAAAVDDMRHPLKLPGDDRAGQTLHVGNTKLGFRRRLQLGFGKSVFDSALTRIVSDNTSFRNLTETIVLSTAGSSRQAQQPDFHKIRATASQIFTLIDAGMQCHCRPEHVLCLDLGLSCSSGLPLSIQGGKASIDQCRRIVLGTKLTPGTQYIADVQVTVPDAVAVKPQSVELKNNDTPTAHRHSSQCLEFLITGGAASSSHSTLPTSLKNTIAPAHIMPVHCFLPNARGQKGKLRGSARRLIALTAALSVLQLYATPWLEEDSFREDIGLIQSQDGSLVDVLLVQKDLCHPKSINKQTRSADPMDLRFICNEWLYGLGIFLIELCLGQTITELRLPQDEVSDKSFQRYIEFRTATRLINVVTQEAGRRYGDVVRRCIRCEFDQNEYDLGNMSFCKAVFKRVVVPLEEDIRHIDGNGNESDSTLDLLHVIGTSMCF